MTAENLDNLHKEAWNRFHPLPGVETVGRASAELIPILEKHVPADRPIRTVVEIGVELGGSTRIFLARYQDARVICCDPWVEDYPLPQQWQYLHEYTHRENGSLFNLFLNFTINERRRVYPVVGYSQNSLGRLATLVDDVDIVYVDGDHRYHGVFADLTLARFLWPKAIIIGDDWRFEGKAPKYAGYPLPVQQAVKDFARHFGLDFKTEGNTYIFA